MSKGDGRQQDVCIQDTSRSKLLSFPVTTQIGLKAWMITQWANPQTLNQT